MGLGFNLYYASLGTKQVIAVLCGVRARAETPTPSSASPALKATAK